MDKVLLIILIFFIAGMFIAITTEPFRPGLFYSMVAGALVIIIYGAMKSRKEQKERRRRNRRSKK